jgi:methionyl-tRNA formyltransferase
MNPSIVFMGSPEFARTILEGLVNNFHVVGVISQPDRPSGRGRVLTAPPVKVFAMERGLETIQPERLREPQVMEKLTSWKPDVIIVAAFGQILRQNLLDLPPYGCINVHASFLPRWRGAAPIQASILHGDAETGVTIMKMDAGIDTGQIIEQETVKIESNDNSMTLSEKLARTGSNLLTRTLPRYLDGLISLKQQDESKATYAGMLKKEDGNLDFSQTTLELDRRVRAFYPWPGTIMQFQGLPLKIHATHVVLQPVSQNSKRSQIGGFPAVHAADGWLVLDIVQPAGKKAMAGDVYLRGVHGWEE